MAIRDIVTSPLVSLELTRAGRSPSTYRTRMAVAGVISGVVLVSTVMLNLRGGAGSSSVATVEVMGQVFGTLCWLTMWFGAVVVTFLLGTDTFARDRRDGVFEIFALTGARPRDIVLAKATVTFLHSEMVILAALPLAAIGSFTGGITMGEFVQTLGETTLAAFVLTGLSLLVSSRSDTAGEAVVVLAMMLSALLTASHWLGFWFGARAGYLVITPGALAIGIASLILTGRYLHTYSDVRHARSPVKRRSRFARRLPWSSPMARLAGAAIPDIRLFRSSFLLRILFAAALLPLALVPVFGGVVVVAFLCYSVCASFAAARRDGSLDLLFASPITSPDLASGLLHAQIARSAWFLPAVAVSWIRADLLAWRAMSFDLWDLAYLASAACGGIVMFPVAVAVSCVLATRKATVTSQGVLGALGFWLLQGCAFTCLVPRPVLSGSSSAIPLSVAGLLLHVLVCLWFWQTLGKKFSDRVKKYWRTGLT